MTVSLILLVPVLAGTVWAFLRSSPRRGDSRALVRFNLGVVIIGLAACVVLTLKLYIGLAGSQDRAWWPVIAALYSLVLFPLILLAGGLIRNLVVFRPRRATGGRS